MAILAADIPLRQLGIATTAQLRPQDLAKAVQWFRRAAEQNHAAAQCNLGVLYAQALGLAWPPWQMILPCPGPLERCG